MRDAPGPPYDWSGSRPPPGRAVSLPAGDRSGTRASPVHRPHPTTRPMLPSRALPNLLRLLALSLLPFLCTQPLAAQSGPEAAREYREAHEAEILGDFAELLTYPNRAFTPEIREAALYIRDQMRAVGVDTRLVEMEGASPLVLGVLEVPGAERTLTIHTDARARKVGEIQEDPRATFHVWDDKRSIQVRARVHVSRAIGEVEEREWEGLSERAQALYGIEPAPATRVDSPAEQPASPSDAARSNFLVLQAEVTTLEWLFLFHAGHRRALFEWQDERWSSAWMVP